MTRGRRDVAVLDDLSWFTGAQTLVESLGQTVSWGDQSSWSWIYHGWDHYERDTPFILELNGEKPQGRFASWCAMVREHCRRRTGHLPEFFTAEIVLDITGAHKNIAADPDAASRPADLSPGSVPPPPPRHERPPSPPPLAVGEQPDPATEMPRVPEGGWGAGAAAFGAAYEQILASVDFSVLGGRDTTLQEAR